MTPTTAATVTILDNGHATEVPAQIESETIRLPARSIKTALGWDVTPDGLVRDGRHLAALNSVALEPDGVDVETLAGLLGRPVAIDAGERVAWFGISAAERTEALASLRAPDFTLPDLHGRLHSLADHRGKKVFLVAYASW